MTTLALATMYAFATVTMPVRMAHMLRSNIDVVGIDGSWNAVTSRVERRRVNRYLNCNLGTKYADVYAVRGVPIAVAAYDDLTSRGTPVYTSIVLNKGAIVFFGCASHMRASLSRRYRGRIGTIADFKVDSI